jgi:hypothetical protein
MYRMPRTRLHAVAVPYTRHIISSIKPFLKLSPRASLGS